MPDAQTPIAELIGWTPEHVWRDHDCIYCGAYEISTIEREYRCEPVDRCPTADDLLTFLGSREAVEMMAYSRNGKRGVNVGAPIDDEWFNFSGDTLLAALEAAVRAVAEAGE